MPNDRKYTKSELDRINSNRTAISGNLYHGLDRTVFIGNAYQQLDPYSNYSAVWGNITGSILAQSDLIALFATKQDLLTSGINIKTINGISLLGSGDISIAVGGVQSVTGLNTDNTDPLNPIIQISVDGVTITGDGTPGNPLISVGGGGENLSTTLAFGNTTGANDIIVATGQKIIGQTSLLLSESTLNSFYYASAGYIFQQWYDGLGTGNTDFLLQGGGTQLFSHLAMAIQCDTGLYDFYEGTAFNGTLDFTNLLANRNYDYPDQSGTIALLSDITTYTDEMAQDAVGAMIDSTLVYTDATPLLQRAALSGDAIVPLGSNVITLADEFQLAMISTFRFLTKN
jgi:hypothetical protein